MFKVFKLFSVEPVEAFRIWQGKLFGSCPVQKPESDAEVLESRKEAVLLKVSATVGGVRRGREERGKE